MSFLTQMPWTLLFPYKAFIEGMFNISTKCRVHTQQMIYAIVNPRFISRLDRTKFHITLNSTSNQFEILHRLCHVCITVAFSKLFVHQITRNEWRENLLGLHIVKNSRTLKWLIISQCCVSYIWVMKYEVYVTSFFIDSFDLCLSKSIIIM